MVWFGGVDFSSCPQRVEKEKEEALSLAPRLLRKEESWIVSSRLPSSLPPSSAAKISSGKRGRRRRGGGNGVPTPHSPLAWEEERD